MLLLVGQCSPSLCGTGGLRAAIALLPNAQSWQADLFKQIKRLEADSTAAHLRSFARWRTAVGEFPDAPPQCIWRPPPELLHEQHFGGETRTGRHPEKCKRCGRNPCRCKTPPPPKASAETISFLVMQLLVRGATATSGAVSTQVGERQVFLRVVLEIGWAEISQMILAVGTIYVIMHLVRLYMSEGTKRAQKGQDLAIQTDWTGPDLEAALGYQSACDTTLPPPPPPTAPPTTSGPASSQALWHGATTAPPAIQSAVFATAHSNMLRDNLKEICRSRGLPVTGLKSDLVDRLEEHDERQRHLQQQQRLRAPGAPAQDSSRRPATSGSDLARWSILAGLDRGERRGGARG